MNIIGLIDKPSGGKLTIQDRDVRKLNRSEMTRLRYKTIGFFFQSSNLLPVLNVYENVELPLMLGRDRLPKKERTEWINHLLEEVGLEDRKNHRPTELYAEGLISVDSETLGDPLYSGSIGFADDFFDDKLSINAEYFYNGERYTYYTEEDDELIEEESPYVYGHN